jgi:peptidoglycan/LPS O-acetylase OafA/YrhL
MNRENNFNILRLLLALSVVVVHTAELSQRVEIAKISRYFSSILAVDSFFIVSGFLIFMSYESSSSLGSYISKRFRRIAPAYIVVILFWAIFLYFISTKSFGEYFSMEFWGYIISNLTTLNFLHPTIDGIFEDNYISSINGALWTIKIEVAFYLLVPIIIYLFSKFNKLTLIFIIYILAILYSLLMVYLSDSSGSSIFLKLEKQIPSQLAFFISGAFLYYYYEIFSRNSLLLFILSSLLLYIHHFITPIYPLYPITLAIVIIYFATQSRYLFDFGRYWDISYGLYIWHFPTIQLFVYYHLFDNLAIGIPLLVATLLLVSSLSWSLIEKRFLSKYPKEIKQ